MKYIKLYEARQRLANSDNFSYAVHHSTSNIASCDYYWDYSKAYNRAIELIKNGKTSNLSIFKRGYYSSSQEEYLVKWWGSGSNYWYNRSMGDIENGDFELINKYIYGIDAFLSKDNINAIINRILSTDSVIINNSYKVFNKIKKDYPNIWGKFKEVNHNIDSSADMGGMGFSD